ncbi:MAG: dihydroorotase [Hyphomonadaceae bacterium]|nr:dihydroorotase [Hyphomonadaceae bacterium]MBX3510495.1 dihydroorotase [Hyphomonadaceae bacterium]
MKVFDLIIRGGVIADHAGEGPGDIGIIGGRIAAIGDLAQASAGAVFDAKGLTVLPGVIDTQVHFREPGNEHKEDLETGTRAAALGGVVAVFEMPNTNPTTSTAEALADKLARAKGRAHVDHAFYVGATTDNFDQLGELERLPGCCGVKTFMGASTGSLLVPDDEGLDRVVANINRRGAFHCEDEARLRERKALAREGDWTSHAEVRDDEAGLLAVQRLVRAARKYRKRVHVLHISSAKEMEFLATAKDVATVETLPQFLTFEAPGVYERLKGFAQMNPPIRYAADRAALWSLGIAQGVVDVIGTDHAPHTREEKAQPYPKSPSGMPGVQTLVPVMLTHVNQRRLSLQRLIDLTSAGANRVFGIANKGRIALGYDADFTIVDMKAKRVITAAEQATRCGWTPFEGFEAEGWPMATIIRGQIVMREGEIVTPSQGAPLRFQETL